MKLNFYPEYDNETFIKSAKAYEQLWSAEGEKIVAAIEKITGLKFVENEINCIVFEGPSYSNPLRLRASYDEFNKKAALVHELCHRIIVGNKAILPNPDEPKVVSAHRVVDLILYETLEELYGKEFANKNVQIESGRSPEYAQAWQWALDMTPEDRRQKFKKLIPQQ